jgi:uncharacterized protein YndB with AHSA1/START domain
MTILYIIIAVLVVLAIVVSMRPSAFRISRSATIAAPPEAVFPHVNDLHKWDAWSPWAKLDPDCKVTFEGPAAGTGASYAWSGNNKVGAGHMLITESKPGELILMKLDFLKPMKATNVTEFTFKPAGNETKVTWTMSGSNNFMGKAFSLFVDCDRMIGGQFEKGLADMKTLVEAETKS